MPNSVPYNSTAQLVDESLRIIRVTGEEPIALAHRSWHGDREQLGEELEELTGRCLLRDVPLHFSDYVPPDQVWFIRGSQLMPMQTFGRVPITPQGRINLSMEPEHTTHVQAPRYTAHSDGTPSVPPPNPVPPLAFPRCDCGGENRYLRRAEMSCVVTVECTSCHRRTNFIDVAIEHWRSGVASHTPGAPAASEQTSEEQRLQKLYDDRVTAGLVDG